MKYTIQNFKKQFPDDDSCLEYIWNKIYGKEFVCPKCEDFGHFYKIKNRKVYACTCGYQVSPLTGTIFHKSSTKLTNWFFAMFLMANSKNGVAALEMQRHLGVTYKCAWRIAKQIRELMIQQPSMFQGTVEVDETFIGTKTNQPGGHLDKKLPVVGIAQRGGKIMAQVAPDVKATTLTYFITETVLPGATLMTDEWTGYHHINRAGYDHFQVNHTSKEWVRGNVHTNTIEGFWGQLKRSITGTYHHVSLKYLQHYVSECSFHYNYRSSPLPLFQVLIDLV